MNLREIILKKLAGTSGQNSVRLDDLRKVAEPICDDLQPLYDLMEKLYGEKIVNRASGFKEGKQYVAYWLTGNTSGVCTPFRISTPAPPARIPVTRQASPNMLPNASKVQPKTADPSLPIIQEKTMSSPSQVTEKIYTWVVKHPGIKQSALVEYAQVECPDATSKQILKSISNLTSSSKRIRGDGNKGDRSFYPATDPAPAVAKPAKVKPKKTAKVASKPVASTAPPRLSVPATFDPEFNFAFGVRKDGGVSIFKGGATISLSSAEVKTIINHTTI